MLHLAGTAVIPPVSDAHRAGSRYHFVESRKSRTVVKRGPVLACRSGRTCATRVHVACLVAAMETPMRKRESGTTVVTDPPIRCCQRSTWTSRSAERGRTSTHGRRWLYGDTYIYQYTLERSRDNFSRYLRELTEHKTCVLINGFITYRWAKCCNFPSPAPRMAITR